MKHKKIDRFMRNGAISLITLAVIIMSCTYFLSDANLFQRFLPRAHCMFENQKLIQLHLVSDFIIFASYTGISAVLFIFFQKMKNAGLPFTDFFWKFGGFILFCGITHLVAVINLFVTFYWLDGLVKLATMWFSFLTFVSLIQSYNQIIKLRTPKEFEELAHRYNELLESLFKRKTNAGMD